MFAAQREAALAELGPEQEEDGSLKSTARVIVAWQGIGGLERENAEASYVERLQLLIPYIKALLVELATIVFLGVAFGHRATIAVQSPAAARTPLAATVRSQPKARPSQARLSRPATVAPSSTVTHLRPAATVAAANCEALAVQLLQRSATVVGQRSAIAQEDIVQLFGGNKSRASRWLGRLEREGAVERWSEGRRKFAALTARASA